MIFNFKNLGPLNEAEVNLGKLTVVCGKNNTGKTYVTNAIYSFLKDWREIIDWKISQEIENDLINKGVAQVDLKKEIVDQINEHISNSTDEFQKRIPDYFATSSEIFENTKIDFKINIDNYWVETEYEGDIKNKNGKVFVGLKKQKNSKYIDIVWFESEETPPFFF